MKLSILDENLGMVECFQANTNWDIDVIECFSNPTTFKYIDEECFQLILEKENSDLFLMEGGWFYQEYINKMGYTDLLNYNNVFFPTLQHRKIEDDRDYGKQICSSIDLSTSKYIMYDPKKLQYPSFLKQLKDFPFEKIVLKHNNKELIKIGTKEEILSSIKQFPDNTYIIEEYVKHDIQMSVSYMVNHNKVLPVCLVYEDNKFFPLGLGPKIDAGGFIMAGVPNFFDDIFTEKIRKWTSKVGYIGWLDVDFGMDKNGNYQIFEFMCRFGYPSTSTMLKLACCDWVDIFYRFLQGETITQKDFQWKHKYAVAIGMFTMTLRNNSFNGPLPVGENILNYEDYFMKSPKDQSQHFVSHDAFYDRDLRIASGKIGDEYTGSGRCGEAIGTDDNWKVAIEKAYKIAEEISYTNKIYKKNIYENSWMDYNKYLKIFNNLGIEL
jgi:phosphoribosylamine-glycine ligase